MRNENMTIPTRVLTQFGLKDQTPDYWVNQNPELRFIGLKQTHSNAIHEIKADNLWKWPDNNLPEGDGLVTDAAGIALVIQTADCLPILIHDQQGQSIAACHAGWRGAV